MAALIFKSCIPQAIGAGESLLFGLCILAFCATVEHGDEIDGSVYLDWDLSIRGEGSVPNIAMHSADRFITLLQYRF